LGLLVPGVLEVEDLGHGKSYSQSGSSPANWRLR
jgi:hypothetical protein